MPFGEAYDSSILMQVDKKTVKTRAFQEACIYSVVDELAKHLAQWSYCIAFFEMSFIPLVRLRSFCKTIKADRFRKEMKDLIHQVCKACVQKQYSIWYIAHIAYHHLWFQIEANVEFIKSKHAGIKFSPNDPAVESFLQARILLTWWLFVLWFNYFTIVVVSLHENVHFLTDRKGRALQPSLKICCYSAPESTGQDGCSGWDQVGSNKAIVHITNKYPLHFVLDELPSYHLLAHSTFSLYKPQELVHHGHFVRTEVHSDYWHWVH